MKKIFTHLRLHSLLMGILVAFTLCLAMQEKADAQNVVIANTYNQRLCVAVVEKPVGHEWVVKGWWDIPPCSTREIVLNNAAGSDKIYIHAHNDETAWGSEILHTIINKSFEYTVGYSCPEGDGRRQVGFDSYYFDQHGYLHLKF